MHKEFNLKKSLLNRLLGLLACSCVLRVCVFASLAGLRAYVLACLACLCA